MKDSHILELIGLIQKNIILLNEISLFCQELGEKTGNPGEQNRTNALAVAGTIENYYTCSETIFLRICQLFENNLNPEKWHRHLLDKMNLEIPDIRPAILSDKSAALFDEILRFRHFKRYYFHLEYDWDRLDFLMKKVKELHAIFGSELNTFIQYLQKISG